MSAPSIEDALLMAVAIYGARPMVARGAVRATANGRPIFRQALTWLGAWNDETHEAAFGEGGHPLVDELYRTLIEMSRVDEAERLVCGFGNLGTDDEPAAAPTFVAFGLTPRGIARAEALAKQYPTLRSLGEMDAYGNPRP